MKKPYFPFLLFTALLNTALFNGCSVIAYNIGIGLDTEVRKPLDSRDEWTKSKNTSVEIRLKDSTLFTGKTAGIQDLPEDSVKPAYEAFLKTNGAVLPAYGDSIVLLLNGARVSAKFLGFGFLEMRYTPSGIRGYKEVALTDQTFGGIIMPPNTILSRQTLMDIFRRLPVPSYSRLKLSGAGITLIAPEDILEINLLQNGGYKYLFLAGGLAIDVFLVSTYFTNIGSVPLGL